MRISETRQRQLALLAEYNQQRRHYKQEQEHSKRAREAKEAGRLYDKSTERTYDFGEKVWLQHISSFDQDADHYNAIDPSN